MDLSLPAVIGITTPGKRTVFLSGRMGTESGRDSFAIASSSSEDIRGIKSASDSISCSDKLSTTLKKDFAILYFLGHYVTAKES